MTTIIRVHNYGTCETETFTGKDIRECLAGLQNAGYWIAQEPSDADGWTSYTAWRGGELDYEITYTVIN